MKKISRFVAAMLMILLILASIVWYLLVYDRNFTRDTLLSQARFHDVHGNSKMSSWFYDMAYSFSGHDQNVAIELANQYKDSGNYTKAELTLTTAINDGPTAELYAALCKTFVEQNKLLDAVNMLETVGDPEIRAQLDAMRPSAPAADYAAGYYSKYMDIHLSSTGNTIYFTADGEYPSTEGPVYSGSISLPAGETTIYAIAVDNNGMVSPVTVLSYTITGVIEEVTFTDPVMEAAIRALIGADPEDTVYTNQLWEIKEFSAPMDVKDFSDLALMPYLENLTILDQNIPSLAPMSSLTALRRLDLTGCEFPAEELAVLTTLPSLSSLTLSGCGLSTISPLADAQALTYLDLSNNNIRHLDVLSPMTTLEELYLQHNAIVDLAPLGSLGSLQKLNVSYNVLKTLSPITQCPKLTWLEANNNALTTLSGMDNLPLLTHLSVDYNELTDVSVLSKCTELTNLSIACNDIVNIEGLYTLVNLQIFDFSSNRVEKLPSWTEECALQTIDGSYNALTNINVLKNMQHLTHIYMDYNLLKNIDALADCFCLVQINVFGNDIEDVSALRERDIIVNYDPTK